MSKEMLGLRLEHIITFKMGLKSFFHSWSNSFDGNLVSRYVAFGIIIGFLAGRWPFAEGGNKIIDKLMDINFEKTGGYSEAVNIIEKYFENWPKFSNDEMIPRSKSD